MPVLFAVTALHFFPQQLFEIYSSICHKIQYSWRTRALPCQAKRLHACMVCVWCELKIENEWNSTQGEMRKMEEKRRCEEGGQSCPHIPDNRWRIIITKQGTAERRRLGAGKEEYPWTSASTTPMRKRAEAYQERCCRTSCLQKCGETMGWGENRMKCRQRKPMVLTPIFEITRRNYERSTKHADIWNAPKFRIRSHIEACNVNIVIIINTRGLGVVATKFLTLTCYRMSYIIPTYLHASWAHCLRPPVDLGSTSGFSKLFGDI